MQISTLLTLSPLFSLVTSWVARRRERKGEFRGRKNSFLFDICGRPVDTGDDLHRRRQGCDRDTRCDGAPGFDTCRLSVLWTGGVMKTIIALAALYQGILLFETVTGFVIYNELGERMPFASRRDADEFIDV